MTFTEAAEAVLRKVGKALHYKKITQMAIDQNLLSHIGKTPEVTMSTRLATLTKKDTPDQNIVRVRASIFGLREWGSNVVVDADSGSDDDEVSPAKPAAAPEAPKAPAKAQPANPAQSGRQGGGERRDGRGNEARGGRRDGRGGDGRNNPAPRGDRRDDRRDGKRDAKPAEPAAPTPALDAAEPVTPPAEPELREPSQVVVGDNVELAAETVSVSDVRVESDAVAEALDALAADDRSSDESPAARSEDVSTKVEGAAQEVLTSEMPTPIPPRPRRQPVATVNEDGTPRDPEEIEREERLAASADMFPEEDDDEEPLLGGGSGATAERDGNRRRRRRRRRRGDGPGDGAPEGAVAGAGTEGGASTDEAPRPARADEGRDAPAPREGRDGRDAGRDGRDHRGGSDRDRDREVRRDRDEAPRDDETGRDASDMLVSLLTRRDDRQPVPMRALVDEALRNGRLSGDPQLHVPALTAAARMDSVRRAARGERPRLRVTGGRVGLMDWTLPSDLVRAEADALAALERLREAARRYVLRRLNELPQASFVEVVVMLLERMGISSLKAARRPGLPQGEIHLAGVSRRGPEEFNVGVVVKRGGEVGRERVIELRGSLHHYGPATAGWILTTNNVLSGAREEAATPGAAPITVLDAGALGRLLDENAVLVSHASVSLPWLDVDLYDLLRGS